MLIDTHCHLDFKDFDADRADVLARAKQAGIDTIINIGSSFDGSKKCVALAQQHDGLYASVGIHPHDAKEVTARQIAELEHLSHDKKVIAIGEVGLDFYRNLSPREAQEKIFREFIRIAKNRNLPLVIHSRDAFEDTLRVLEDELAPPLRGVMHCFSGGKDALHKVLELGLRVSFTCNITFPKAVSLRSLVEDAPLGKLLLETDAPFLAPQAQRGRRNEPANVRVLAEEIARLKKIHFDRVAAVTTRNAKELFCF